MKRIISGIFAISTAVFFMSCNSGPQVRNEPVKQAAVIEEGWVSDNEFRVKVSGETDTTSSNADNIRKSSEAAAVKKARETVVKSFVTIRMKQSPGAGTYAIVALGIDKDFRDIIEGGVIIAKTFSSDSRRCEIVYKVEKDGLKNMVEQKK